MAVQNCFNLAQSLSFIKEGLAPNSSNEFSSLLAPAPKGKTVTTSRFTLKENLKPQDKLIKELVIDTNSYPEDIMGTAKHFFSRHQVSRDFLKIITELIDDSLTSKDKKVSLLTTLHSIFVDAIGFWKFDYRNMPQRYIEALINEVQDDRTEFLNRLASYLHFFITIFETVKLKIRNFRFKYSFVSLDYFFGAKSKYEKFRSSVSTQVNYIKKVHRIDIFGKWKSWLKFEPIPLSKERIEEIKSNLNEDRITTFLRCSWDVRKHIVALNSDEKKVYNYILDHRHVTEYFKEHEYEKVMDYFIALIPKIFKY